MARDLPFYERNLRRLRIYAGRTLRSGPLPKPRHPGLFLHLPKCGGTSIAEALYGTVPLGQGVTVIDAVSTRRAAAILAFGRDDPMLAHEDLAGGHHVFALREALMLQAMAWGSRLIHGHVLYSARAEAHFGDRYQLVTLMREPQARMLSNYRMALRAGVVSGGLDAYLDGPVAVSHAQVYLRYLSGQNMTPPEGVAEAVALARARLARFAVLGFLDDLAGFGKTYAEVFGVTPKIHAYNRAEGAPPDLTPGQRRRVAELCAPDEEIYAAARDRRRADG